MPQGKPPSRKPAPRAAERDETTDPGGPSPLVLQQARGKAAPLPESDDVAPVAPGPGEATLVYDKNKGRARGAADPVKLVAIAGPRKGREFALTEDVTTIGRGSDNVLVIPDISVSRQHVIVQREGERWVVLDQGSGNGTKVNGKPVERYPLQHGDEIAMGDTILQVVEPGGVVVRGAKRAEALADAGEPASPAAVQQSLFKKRVPLYLAILGALFLALGAGVVRKQRRAREEAASAQGDESRALAQQRFQEGVALLKQGRWVDARAKLKLAAELDSADPEIARYLESAAAEAPRAQGLAAAKAALGRKDFAAAHAALADIPDDSALAEGARDLEQQLAAALDAAVREAKARAEEGDAAGAAELLEPVLAADPQRADALAVRAVIGSPRPQRAAAAPSQRRERAARPERTDSGEAPAAPAEVQPILDAYLSGDLGAALERAEAAQSNPRALRLLGQFKTFDAAYKEGLARSQAKKTNEALRSLESAASADRAIAQGKDSRLGREVRKALSQLHYQIGIAQVATDEGLPQAATHLRAALSADPANDLAQQQLAQVIARAKELYLRGYVAKDSDADTARHAFKIVTETLPASEETAQKAKRWLDKLDGKGPKEDG